MTLREQAADLCSAMACGEANLAGIPVSSALFAWCRRCWPAKVAKAALLSYYEVIGDDETWATFSVAELWAEAEARLRQDP